MTREPTGKSLRQSNHGSAALALFFALSALGCGGRAETNGAATPSATPTGDGLGGDLEPDPSWHGIIASYAQAGGVALYPPNPISSTPPLTTLDGSWLTDTCVALAFDAKDNLYALCDQADYTQPLSEINVFAPLAQGDASPSRVIAGPDTTIGGDAADVAVDKAGNIYVAQNYDCELQAGCLGTISVFARAANGDATPTRVIQGPDTGLIYSAAIAVNDAGLIYVGSTAGGPLLVFAADATGDAQPVRRIGSSADIGYVTRIALDSSGMIYVTDVSRSGLLVYGPSSAEGDAPERVITGPNTGLVEPLGIALDDAGRLLISDAQGQNGPATLSLFSHDADGDVAPEAVIPNVAGLGIAVAP